MNRAYRETEPAPRLVLCSVGECERRVYARGMCSMHYQRMMRHGTIKPRPGYPRHCSVPECDEAHYGHGLCRNHWARWKATGNPIREPDSPYYANLPCPSCGSRATVPFDPRPERAGREPSTDLATCVACHHTWPSAPCSPTEAAGGSPLGHGTVGGHGGGGRKSVRGVKAAAVASDKAQPGRANSRAGDAPAVTGTTGAA